MQLVMSTPIGFSLVFLIYGGKEEEITGVHGHYHMLTMKTGPLLKKKKESMCIPI